MGRGFESHWGYQRHHWADWPVRSIRHRPSSCVIVSDHVPSACPRLGKTRPGADPMCPRCALPRGDPAAPRHRPTPGRTGARRCRASSRPRRDRGRAARPSRLRRTRSRARRTCGAGYAPWHPVLPANPCDGTRLPRVRRAPIRALTMDQVRKLADECAPHQLVVWTLALTGLRWGELCALTPSDLDVKRRRLSVSRSMTELNGVVKVSSTKTGQSREVPVPGWLVDELAKIEGEWLFTTSRGGHWRQSTWKRVWPHPAPPSGRSLTAPGRTCAPSTPTPAARPATAPPRRA